MNSLDDRARSPRARLQRAEIIARVLAARENRAGFLEEMRSRQRRGHEVARRCARILKERFGASRVVLFGSMLDTERLTPHSDIDLAVRGLPERDYFRAVAALLDVDPEFSVDLVEEQRATPHILKAIERGIEI